MKKSSGSTLAYSKRNIEVAVLAQDARVPQLEFRLVFGSATIYRHELLKGKARLRDSGRASDKLCVGVLSV